MKAFPPWVIADETSRLLETDEHEAIQEIVADERQELLKQCQLTSPYWRGFKSSEITLLADKVDLLKLGEGEYLARNREQACFFGVYLKGHAYVTDERKQKIGQLSAGDILGEFTFFSGGFRGADIVTKSQENIVAIFPFQDFMSLYLSVPKIGSKIIYNLIRTGFSRMVQLGNKKNALEAVPVAKKQPSVDERRQLLSKAIDKCKVLNLSPDAVEVLLQYGQFVKYNLTNQEVFKQKQKSNVVIFVLSGRLAEGDRMIGAGEFAGESSILQEYIEWSFRRHTLNTKAMTYAIGIKVSEIHELISEDVHIGLSLYLSFARSWLLKYKPESEVSMEYFFDLEENFLDDKLEVMIKAVVDLQRSEKKATAQKRRGSERRKSSIARRVSISLAEIAPYHKKAPKNYEQEQEAHMVQVLKDMDFNADMLHSCLCYSTYLRGFKQRQIDVLSSVMTFVEVKSGHNLTKDGEYAAFIGFLVSGGAEVVADGKVVRELVTGDIIGEVELFLGGTRFESIVSSSDNTVIAYMTFKELLGIAQRQPQLCIKLLNCLLNAAVSRFRYDTYKTPPPVTNIPVEEVDAVSRSQRKGGLGKLFKSFIKEDRLAEYLKKATFVKLPQGSPAMVELLLLPNVVYVCNGSVEFQVAGADKVNVASNSFLPDFRLLKSDSMYNIRSASVTADCTLMIFDHHVLREIRREYPLLSAAFQLHLCKLNLDAVGYKTETIGAISKKMKAGERELTKTEKLRMESIMAKKAEQHKEELKKAQMKRRLKRKNAKLLKRRVTLATAVRDNKNDEVEANAEPVTQELFQLLDQMQLLSKCFRRFNGKELTTVASIMKLQHFNEGEMIVRKGDHSTFVVFMLAGKAGIDIKDKKGETLSKIELRVGDILGEMALFEGGVRSADVISASDSTVVGILEFKGIVYCHNQNPELGMKLIHAFVSSAMQKLRAFYLKQNSPLESHPPEKEIECTEEIINESGIFSSLLSSEEVKTLCGSMSLVKYEKGDTVISQGDLSSEIFIVVSGSLRSSSSHSSVEVEHKVGYMIGADLLRPDVLIRYYSAYAYEDSVVATLKYDKFVELNNKAPIVAFKFAARMAQEIVWVENEILQQKVQEKEHEERETGSKDRFRDWSKSADLNETLFGLIAENPSKYEVNKIFKKTELAEDLLKDCQKHSTHFHGFEESEIVIMANRVRTLKLQKDEYIVHEGDDACFVSVILKGSAAVLYQGQTVGTLEEGDVLGELSLFEQFSRGADVVVQSQISLVSLFTFEDLRQIHIEKPDLGLKLLRTFTNAACTKLRKRCLNNIASESFNVTPCSNDMLYQLLVKSHSRDKGLGEEMDNSALQYLAARMCFIKFDSGDLILKRGQKASFIMFVLEGTTGVRIGGKIIAKRSAGNFVGETAFFQGFSDDYSERTADVVADGEVLIAAVSYKQLEDLNKRHPLIALLLFSRIGELMVQRLRNQKPVSKPKDSDKSKPEEMVEEEEEQVEAPSDTSEEESHSPSESRKRASVGKIPEFGAILEGDEEEEDEDEEAEEEEEPANNGLLSISEVIAEGDEEEEEEEEPNEEGSLGVISEEFSNEEDMNGIHSLDNGNGLDGGDVNSAMQNGQTNEHVDLKFTYDEMSRICVEYQSLVEVQVNDIDKPSKEELLKMFIEAKDQMQGKLHQQQKDNAKTEWEKESAIRKLEVENTVLKEEIEVKDSDLKNLYTMPHVLEFFESRVERLQGSLNDKVKDWQRERERSEDLLNQLNEARKDLSWRDDDIRAMKMEFQVLKRSFGSLAKSSSTRKERLPRHIETLQRSASVSPDKFSRSARSLHSERSVPNPSLAQRLQLAKQRSATAELTPVTKNFSKLLSRPSTQFSGYQTDSKEPSEILEVRSALSFDHLD